MCLTHSCTRWRHASISQRFLRLCLRSFPSSASFQPSRCLLFISTNLRLHHHSVHVLYSTQTAGTRQLPTLRKPRVSQSADIPVAQHKTPVRNLWTQWTFQSRCLYFTTTTTTTTQYPEKRSLHLFVVCMYVSMYVLTALPVHQNHFYLTPCISRYPTRILPLPRLTQPTTIHIQSFRFLSLCAPLPTSQPLPSPSGYSSTFSPGHQATAAHSNHVTISAKLTTHHPSIYPSTAALSWSGFVHPFPFPFPFIAAYYPFRISAFYVQFLYGFFFALYKTFHNKLTAACHKRTEPLLRFFMAIHFSISKTHRTYINTKHTHHDDGISWYEFIHCYLVFMYYMVYAVSFPATVVLSWYKFWFPEISTARCLFMPSEKISAWFGHP